MTEQEGFRPAGVQARTGRCTLCGARAKLTKAHVPPKAAFNKGDFSWAGTTADNRLANGRPRLGGASRYAHCQSCRAATSPWDDEYIRWAYAFAHNLLHSQWKGERTYIEGKLSEVRPGRFIRSALAGMTALVPRLIDTHPDLVGAVRQGIPIAPPEDIRFLMAIAPDKTAAIVEGAHEGVAIQVSSGDGGGSSRPIPTISAVVHFPPLSLLLADQQLVSSLPHVDCTDFLQFGVDEVADVSLVLPVVDLPRTPGAPVPVSMLRFREARA